MIHYHGTPITPKEACLGLTRRHAMVSFARPDNLIMVAEICQSFAFDNGAFSLWKAGKGKVDQAAYLAWVNEWRQHPGFDWCLIPDVIDGTEEENNQLVDKWALESAVSVPVWHLHESLERLEWLCDEWPRVAFGSSGQYAQVGNKDWWLRMDEAMLVACDLNGRPRAKLHGLRMLNPTVFSKLPFSSADSTNVGRNVGIDSAWKNGQYQPLTKETRALVLMERIEMHASAARYTNCSTRANPELVG